MINHFIQFVINHWVLWAALVVVLVLLVLDERKTVSGGVKRVAPQLATNMINHDNAVVVDVRSADQFSAGHLPAAINISYADLTANINKLTKYKNKSIILVCTVGQEAAKAGAFLKKSDFNDVYVLAGGVSAWQKADLPLVNN